MLDQELREGLGEDVERRRHPAPLGFHLRRLTRHADVREHFAAGLAREPARRLAVHAAVPGAAEHVRVVAADGLAHVALDEGREALAEPERMVRRRQQDVDGLVQVGRGIGAHALGQERHVAAARHREGKVAGHPVHDAPFAQAGGGGRAQVGLDVGDALVEKAGETGRLGRAQRAILDVERRAVGVDLHRLPSARHHEQGQQRDDEPTHLRPADAAGGPRRGRARRAARGPGAASSRRPS
jgi:hypothetical protein